MRDLRAENGFLYVNGLDGRTALYAESGSTWSGAGGHDVRDWVDGVVEEGRFSVRRRPGRLWVASRQAVAP